MSTEAAKFLPSSVETGPKIVGLYYTAVTLYRFVDPPCCQLRALDCTAPRLSSEEQSFNSFRPSILLPESSDRKEAESGQVFETRESQCATGDLPWQVTRLLEGGSSLLTQSVAQVLICLLG